MEAPKTVIDGMASTSSAEVTWFDDGYGLIDGIRMHRAPSFAEWVAATCGSFTHEEYKLLLSLQERMGSGRSNNRALALFDKQARIQICEHQLISSNRDKLPPP